MWADLKQIQMTTVLGKETSCMTTMRRVWPAVLIKDGKKGTEDALFWAPGMHMSYIHTGETPFT